MKKRISKEIGLPPGSLIYTGKHKDVNLQIEAGTYNEQEIEVQNISLEELKDWQEKPDRVNWFNITGLHDTEFISAIGNKFGIHPLQLEDVLNTNQRPKAEINENSVFVTLRMATPTETALEEEQISFFLTGKTLVALQEKPGDVLDPIRQRVRTASGRIRSRGADYLLYSLMDVIVDSYFHVLEDIGNDQEDIEENIGKWDNNKVNLSIRHCKRKLTILRKAIYPLREAISSIRNGDYEGIDSRTQVYFKDLMDHVIQLTEMLETFREMNGDLHDINTNTLSNKMNEIVKVLTMFSTVFIPLSFLAAVYGMNFDNLPELHWHTGYYYFWGVCALTAIGMFIYFIRKKWL